MTQSYDSYDNEYYKNYMKDYRKKKKEKLENNEEEFNSKIEFKSKNISIAQFKKHYKGKLENKEQELIFNNCLDLITLIDEYKQVIEKEGTYYKNTTGNIKINPIIKEHRDTIKAFTSLLCILHELLEPEEKEKKKENRFVKFAK